MKSLLLFSILFTLNSGFSQSEDDSLINVAIDGFFSGLNSSDTSKINKVVYGKSFDLKSLLVSKYNETKLEEEQLEEFLKMVAAPKEVTFEERILERKILTDGFVATAWLPYEFYVNGKYSHEGVNMIQFAKLDGKWLMVAITDSRKRKIK